MATLPEDPRGFVRDVDHPLKESFSPQEPPMPESYDPSAETYQPEEAAAALRQAVEQLARDTGQPLDSFPGRSLAEIAQLADSTYNQLPEFWQVWKSWHTPQPKQEMGDL